MMNRLTLLAGIAIGAVLTAGVAQLQAQAPAPADTTRRRGSPAGTFATRLVRVMTEETSIKKFEDLPPGLVRASASAGLFLY
jgi:hypothetical protein